MGLFPRTVGKGFSCARTGGFMGADPHPACPGEGTGGREMPGEAHAGPCIFIRHHKMWG
jgi:hypothetical protein